MKRLLGPVLAATFLVGHASTLLADEKEAIAVLDKAITAHGGEEKLAKSTNAVWSAKGTINFNDNESPIKTVTKVQGIDRFRAEFEGEFNGGTFKGVTVVNVDKGWRKFGEEAQELDVESLASEKRRGYLQAAPMTILPLKGKDFKLESAPDAKIGEKSVAVVKVKGPDGKEFTLSFDKETGLVVKLSATVLGFGGEEYLQESTFSDYKDFGGLKRATKLETKRDGNPFIKQEVTDYKVVDKHDADTFTEPK